jgi:hypothetical protein
LSDKCQAILLPIYYLFCNFAEKADMDIRRFSLLVLVLVVISAVVVLSYGDRKKPTFQEKLAEAIKYSRIETYHDSYYDYEEKYPAFFEQVPDSLIDEEGASLFRCGNVELSAQVIPNSDNLNMQEGMQHFAALHHASCQRQAAHSFILFGPLYINNSRMPNYRFYSKYVRHRKLWFVQTLTYPDSCAKAVAPLIRQIDDWAVWEKPI